MATKKQVTETIKVAVDELWKSLQEEKGGRFSNKYITSSGKRLKKRGWITSMVQVNDRQLEIVVDGGLFVVTVSKPRG